MAGDGDLAGRKVLVVEDEAMICMMLEDMLDDLGCTVVGPAADLDGAVALARDAAIDVAILDVNLNGVPSDAVADLLTARGVPFVVATGYGKGGLVGAHQEAPVLSKPYGQRELARTLTEALRRRDGPAAGR